MDTWTLWLFCPVPSSGRFFGRRAGEKTCVIPSGINPAGYPRVEDRNVLRQKFGFRPEDVLIVTVGALVPHKDHATLIRAAARVVPSYPQAKFLLLGEGPLRGDLEVLARREGVADRVLFLGHRPEVLEYTAMADLFVFSSVEEGLGTALLDALVIGVPTAATAAGGFQISMAERMSPN
jgi:glycosyltransferase involved in cell wall biosynthesis